MKKIKLNAGNLNFTSGTTVRLFCPHCGQLGTFESLKIADLQASYNVYLGQRHCPDPACRGHIFFVIDNDELTTYPSETIPFKKENIPTRIINAFDEAVISFSNSCFIASAIMIRKTLEEICVDRGATGDNLKKKIAALGSKIIIPKELLEGMDELRLLGNDAAHIEAQVFEEIGQEEIRISIEFTIEILKAVYQLETLLNKLRSLKKPPAPAA